MCRTGADASQAGNRDGTETHLRLRHCTIGGVRPISGVPSGRGFLLVCLKWTERECSSCMSDDDGGSHDTLDHDRIDPVRIDHRIPDAESGAARIIDSDDDYRFVRSRILVRRRAGIGERQTGCQHVATGGIGCDSRKGQGQGRGKRDAWAYRKPFRHRHERSAILIGFRYWAAFNLSGRLVLRTALRHVAEAGLAQYGVVAMGDLVKGKAS